jgi:hypothetical protein
LNGEIKLLPVVCITFKYSIMKSKNFTLRNEELPVFAEFVETSFLLDRELFAAFSPRYANGFAEEYRKKLEVVKELTTPLILTGERKRATENLHVSMDTLNALLDKLQHFCTMANENLSFHPDDLKIKDLRKSIRYRNSEATLMETKSVRQVLQKNLQVLEEVGFSRELQDELNTLITGIESSNKAQNDLLNERRRLIEDNTTLLNELWEMIRNIMKAGRIIHRKNPLRRTEYTRKNVTSRVRLVIAPKQDDKTSKPPEEVITKETVKEEELVASS